MRWYFHFKTHVVSFMASLESDYVEIRYSYGECPMGLNRISCFWYPVLILKPFITWAYLPATGWISMFAHMYQISICVYNPVNPMALQMKCIYSLEHWHLFPHAYNEQTRRWWEAIQRSQRSASLFSDRIKGIHHMSASSSQAANTDKKRVRIE